MSRKTFLSAVAMLATLAMLVELAGERQTLLLTCHRSQYELAQSMGSCNLLDLG